MDAAVDHARFCLFDALGFVAGLIVAAETDWGFATGVCTRGSVFGLRSNSSSPDGCANRGLPPSAGSMGAFGEGRPVRPETFWVFADERVPALLADDDLDREAGDLHCEGTLALVELLGCQWDLGASRIWSLPEASSTVPSYHQMGRYGGGFHA